MGRNAVEDDIVVDHSINSFSLSEEEEMHGNESSDDNEQLAKKESRVIFGLRLAVAQILVPVTLGVAFAVYSNTANSETTRFENQFQNDANRVVESIGASFEKAMRALDVLALTIVSSAQAMNQTWPFVTLPNFELHVAKVLPLTKSIFIRFAPLVAPENRLQWESYSIEQHAWVNQTIRMQKKWKNSNDPNIDNWNAYGTIHGDFDDMPYNLTRPYMPTWQNYPIVSGLHPPFNWDYLSLENAQPIYTCIENHMTVLSEAYLISDPENASDEEKASALYYDDFIHPDENATQPASKIFYPIIDDLESVEVADEKDYEPTEHRFVGMLSSTIYWRSLIKDILSAESSRMVVVFTNPCNPPFTYQISGPHVNYLGSGDRHDKQFDPLVIQSPLSNLTSYSASDSEYTGAPLDPYCPFTLHVFPSVEMKDAYMTNNPIIFTVLAVMLFVFTSIVFLLYDFMVERRQKLVMTSAVRTNAIVSSLFPEAVRDRLYPAQMDEIQRNGFRSSTAGNAFRKREPDTSESLCDRPIAELYPETTVLFCDIAGFTAWSASRQPWEVFHLLETIYGAFDQIARQWKVFKVETIGDCYVAVVGLPEPRKHHAAVMARFARDCRAKMHELVVELGEKLGEDTKNLALRFGLNSGPTTAGVLRGEKGRFQLFGDTVNTAARMESNSERNRIQVSQSTADLLIADGLQHWLTPRKDLVNAKGKGLLQTYWCEPQSRGGLPSIVESSAVSLPDNDFDVVDRHQKVDEVNDDDFGAFENVRLQF